MTHSDGHVAGLYDVVADLRHLSREADSQLSGVGGRLGDIVGVLDGLTHCFESLPLELEDPALHAAAERFRQVSHEIVVMAQSLVDEGAGLLRLAELNRQMGARIARLRKTVHAIATLAVNAQIEVAQIDVRDEDLSSFAKEIIRLAKAAENTVESYLREHETLTKVLQSAFDAQVGFARTHEPTLRSAGEKLEASLDTIEARRRQAADAAGQIREQSKQIGQNIGAAVMALQIGDITRQRIEHVGEAVAMIASGWEEGDREAPPAMWSATLSENEKSAVAATACRMQSAQTALAASEFGDEVHRIVGSLSQLAEEAAAIVHFGTEAYGTADRRGASFLEGLQENLRIAGALLGESRAARDRVDSVVTAVGTSLGNLLDRLGSARRIEVDMHLVGLNTALKCGRLGHNGGTLSVVAHELRGYAKQTVQDADALMAALREVTAAAESFEHGRRGQGADRIGVLESEMAASLGPFEVCGERLSRALETLSRNGGEVHRSLEQTAAEAAVHERIAKALATAGDRLETLMDSDVPGDEVDPVLVRERLSLFSTGRYTMASERDIHARFVQGASAIATLSAPAAASVDTALDDILF